MDRLELLLEEFDISNKLIRRGDMKYKDQRYWWVRAEIVKTPAFSPKLLKMKAKALTDFIEIDEENGVFLPLEEKHAMESMIKDILNKAKES